MNSTMMRAALLVAEGDPETAFELRDVAAPEPAASEVRVRVSHAALNHLDVWIRRGQPRVPLPRILGADAVGTVEALGDGAEALLAARGIRLGDRVVLDPGSSCGGCRACATGETSLCAHFRVLGEHADGTLAQLVVAPAASIHLAPAHLDDAAAASLMLAHATAWRMLFTRARAQPHERVLVWGASSGVGAAALQLCAAIGIETIATTRSEGKTQALRDLGADHVVVTGGATGESAACDAIDTITSGDGVDVAFDHLGAAAWKPSMQALARGGRYVTCGATTGGSPAAGIHRLFWKQLSMLGSTMASRRDVLDMLAIVNRHKIAPRVDSTWPLDQIASAHRHLESSSQVGKVVIDVAGSR